MEVLSFTVAAKEAIQQVMDSQSVPDDYFLRVGIRGGGCGSMGYILGFDSKKEEDKEYEVEGLKVLIDQRHSMYVLGMEVDFVENEEVRGFVFNNPVARKD